MVFRGYHPMEARYEIQSTTRSADEGFDAGLNSFVQYYGSKNLDASLLMIPLVGFLPADDARVAGNRQSHRETSLCKTALLPAIP